MSEIKYDVEFLTDFSLNSHTIKKGNTVESTESAVKLNLEYSISDIFTSPVSPISKLSLPALKSMLLYNAQNHVHAKTFSPFSSFLKIYYQAKVKSGVSWYGERPTSNFIIIRGDESFSEFQEKWQAKLANIIAQKEKEQEADTSSISITKNNPTSNFLLREDLLNPSHFVLASFILLLMSFLAPAPLLLCSLITGLLAAPALLGYLAIKSSNDFQLLNEHLWSPLVDSEGIPEKIKQSVVPSCMQDTLAAQRAIKAGEASSQTYKDSTKWQLLAYFKALPIRGLTWMNKHPYQATVIGLGIVGLAILMMCMFTIPGFPFNAFDFISHQLVEGIQGIIAWAPDTLGFLNNLITPVATDVITGIIFLAGSLSIIDNVRRAGRAVYAAFGNITEKFEGADPDDFAELKIDADEGLSKNYVVDSYRDTILWRKAQVDNQSDLQMSSSPNIPKHK